MYICVHFCIQPRPSIAIYFILRGMSLDLLRYEEAYAISIPPDAVPSFSCFLWSWSEHAKQIPQLTQNRFPTTRSRFATGKGAWHPEPPSGVAMAKANAKEAPAPKVPKRLARK